jgi:hypothetical protein
MEPYFSVVTSKAESGHVQQIETGSAFEQGRSDLSEPKRSWVAQRFSAAATGHLRTGFSR